MSGAVAAAVLAASLMLVPTVVAPGDVPTGSNINASCGGDFHADITYPTAPTEPWNFAVIAIDLDGNEVHTVVTDLDSDLMGFHVTAPATVLPDGSYFYYVVAYNSTQQYPGIITGYVDCGDPLPTASPTPTWTPPVSPTPITPTVPTTTIPTPSPSPMPSATPVTPTIDPVTPLEPVEPEPSSSAEPTDETTSDAGSGPAAAAPGDPHYTG